MPLRVRTRGYACLSIVLEKKNTYMFVLFCFHDLTYLLRIRSLLTLTA